VSILGFIAAIALGATLVVSGLGKLRDPGGFVLAVLEYEVLPKPLAVAYGRVLPILELVCGLALLVGAVPRLSGGAAGALLLSFLVAVVINLARGRSLDCHCFGAGSGDPLGWVTVLRLGVLLACAFAAAAWRDGIVVPLPPNAMPAVLLSLALVLLLYLLRAVPIQWGVWGMRAPASWKEPRRGRMIWLRNEPLVLGIRRRPIGRD